MFLLFGNIGDGGGASDLLNSLGPLLQHLAGALQQPGDTTLLQQQVLFPIFLGKKFLRMFVV